MALVVKVRCQGAQHDVVLSDSGRLVLPNHEHLGREQKLVEFGQECRCLEVLHAWRNYLPQKLPRELRKVRDGKYFIHRERIEAQADTEMLKGLDTLKNARIAFIQAEIKQALKKGYRTPRVTEVDALVVGRKQPVGLQSRVEEGWKAVGKTDWRKMVIYGKYTIKLHMTWWWKVFRRGLMWYKKRLVLDIKEVKKGFQLSIIQPGEKYTLTLEKVFLTPTELEAAVVKD